MSTEKTVQPMDATAIEVRNPVEALPRQRPCYAIKTLVAEVQALFPETEYEVSDYDGRNVGHEVSFKATEELSDLLFLVESDTRVAFVTIDAGQDGGATRVAFKHDSRLQDVRDSFDLADAWLVMEEEGESA